MYTKLISASVLGVNGRIIEVEVDIASGLPQVNIVGLPDTAVRESVERVRAAVKNCGFQFPLQRITVNLAPADMRKEGTAYDLAIAAGVLAASGQVASDRLRDALLIGELALNGDIKPVSGVLPMVEQAKRNGVSRVLLAAGNLAEASLIGGMELEGLACLKSLLAPEVYNGQRPLTRSSSVSFHAEAASDGVESSPPALDFADVLGQHQAKQALLTAVAGRHNLLLCGPPGTGKTMLIQRIPGIMPPLSDEEALEVTKIYSVAGKFAGEDARLLRSRPFRTPHHTISAGGLIGGGTIPKPGETTLAHHGVLFLDELPEFSRQVLEVLRQPLEEQSVTIARARAVLTFPARFMLACSMNPCPCGFYGSVSAANISTACTCSANKIAAYRNKISGPLLDRIDVQVEVPRPSSFLEAGKGMSSAEMLEKVLTAKERQEARRQSTGVNWNSELYGSALRQTAKLDAKARQLLEQAYQLLGLSMRAHDRLLKLSRTIADLQEQEQIKEEHIAEAIQYRCLDRKTEAI
ncbi:YifB family Mg chelatase-like AAA ATPase [Paenibacillus sp. GCM10012307]|uniref:YifB family Mg chelatase-like AAA ATPase n=1 Tax=Paenibacillus roseus TaxID=2798579 RepID=A0A934J851_9BACL|nr:YifB family Mg chelatase-like AAA ATPase [Paenibacillus roseus]MBJ6363363.1 YifB family Mg chelatase-like AAA ATPase [Paenibacillus roseus]